MLQLPDRTRQALLQIARESDLLLFGELHGTQEVPELISSLLDDLTALGYGGLDLEFPGSVQEPLMQWASGASDSVPELFTRPPSNGTNGEQALATIRQAVRRRWQLLCFDTEGDHSGESWPERDSAMADNLAARWRARCPDRKVLAVCGNLHSRLTPDPEPYHHLWPSFAACFQQRNPERVVRSIDIQFHGGAFFNNCQVHTIQDDPLPETELREGSGCGHPFVLHLPHATPPTFFTSPAK
jgi:hypothetical protein